MSFEFGINKKYCYRNGDTLEQIMETQHYLFPIVSQEGSGILHSHSRNGADATSSDFDLVEIIPCAGLKENDLVVVWLTEDVKFIKPFSRMNGNKIITKDIPSGNERSWNFGKPFKDFNLEKNFSKIKHYWDNVKCYTPVMVWLSTETPVLKLFHRYDNSAKNIITQNFKQQEFQIWKFGVIIEDFDFTNPNWDSDNT